MQSNTVAASYIWIYFRKTSSELLTLDAHGCLWNAQQKWKRFVLQNIRKKCIWH